MDANEFLYNAVEAIWGNIIALPAAQGLPLARKVDALHAEAQDALVSWAQKIAPALPEGTSATNIDLDGVAISDALALFFGEAERLLMACPPEARRDLIHDLAALDTVLRTAERELREMGH